MSFRKILLIFGAFLFLIFPVVSAENSKRASMTDEELLELIEHKSFLFFVKEANPQNGLVRDRANNFIDGGTKSAASIASVGFALTAYGVGVERGWMDRSSAMERTRRTLRFFLEQAPQEHGFFYHFLDMETGERIKNSELSPIDTALFLAGALFAAEYYDDSGIRDLANKIYERVDWNWMLHGGETLALAWSPEQGFDKRRWDHYSENMIMYLMAIGSPTHPIPASSWQAIRRPVGSYKNFRVLQMPPLFTHQYSQIWIDFKNKNDGHADYFQNSVNATLANRAFCIDQAAKFPGYGPDSWGLTASDGPAGYKAYGAPPGWASHDGTLAPTACGGSIVFTPKESIACLRNFYEEYQDRLWGKYGFSDAFNPGKDWFDQDVIGIDQGALLLMIENYRTGLIWKTMDKNPSLMKAMQEVGFKPGTMEIPWSETPVYQAPYIPSGIQVDGYLKDWPNKALPIILDKKSLEFGTAKGDEDLSARVRFAWDENALYFAADVSDSSLIARKRRKNIWQDDLLEIYIDPEGNGLYWNNPMDFQIGFRPDPESEGVEIWSWFQGATNQPDLSGLSARGFVYGKGYLIEGSIRWSFLGMEPPEPGKVLRLSVALHDIDKDRSEGKLQWFFRNEEEFGRFELGKIILNR